MAASQSIHGADPSIARNLWLAGPGLASVARREAGSTARNAETGACRLRGNAIALAGDARDVARGLALTARERIQPLADKIVGQVVSASAGIGSLAESVRTRPAASARKPAPRKRTPAVRKARPARR